MQTLQIFLLGPVDLVLGDRRISAFPTRKSRSLFAYLVLSRGRVIPREVIMGEFWGDLPEPRARKALNTEFWRVGQTLRKHGLEPEAYFHSNLQGLGFRARSAFELDVAKFDETIAITAGVEAEQAPDSTIRAIADAVSLYRGDLLQGVFDDWCLIQREALRARYLFALEYLMRARMARKAWDKALTVAHTLLGTDPLQEHIHRAVMRCHYLLGNRPAAVKQYAACAQLLRRELDVEPMEETTRIYETIIAVTPRAPEVHRERMQAPARAKLKGRRTALEEVNLAIANIDTARGWLVDASEQISAPGGAKPR